MLIYCLISLFLGLNVNNVAAGWELFELVASPTDQYVPSFYHSVGDSVGVGDGVRDGVSVLVSVSGIVTVTVSVLR